MRKILLSAALIFTAYITEAQPFKVTSCQTYLDSYFAKEGDVNLEKAKTEIDEAVANEKTTTWGKAWYLKGMVYQSMIEHKDLAEKYKTVTLVDECYEAYKKAMNLNDVKFRDQENLFNYMNSVCSYLNNRGVVS